MPDIQMPNGDVVNFPDDMPKEQIRSLIQQKFPKETSPGAQPSGGEPAATDMAPQPSVQPEPQAPAQQPPTMLQRLGRWAKSAGRAAFDQSLQGATAQFSDEVTDRMGAGIAAVATGRPYSEILPEARASTKQRLEQQREDHPYVSGAAQIAGGATTGGIAARMVPAAGAGLQAVTKALPGQTMGIAAATRGAIVGAPAGAIYAMGGADQGSRLDAAGEGAVSGAVGGAVLAPVAGAAGNVVRNTLGPLATKAQAYVQRKSRAQQNIENYLKTRPDLPNMIAQAGRRDAMSKEMGVPLSLGDRLNDDALRAEAATLRIQPETAGRMNEFIDRQRASAPIGINKMIDDIAPVQTADEAGAQLVDAAKNKIDGTMERIQAKASPYYEEAKLNQIAPDHPVLKSIEVQRAIKKARSEYADEIPAPEIPKGPDGKDLPPGVLDSLRRSGQLKEGVPDNSIAVLHHAKMQLDIKMQEALEEGSETRARYIGQKIDRLLNAMDEASPEYAKGRQVYVDGMPEYDRLRQGRLGNLTRLRATGSETATEQLFRGSPTATKAMVDDVGPDVALKAGAGELRRVADANKNNPLTLPSKVMGPTPSADNIAKWQTVLGPEKYDRFAQQMDVLAQAAKSDKYYEGSRTQVLSAKGDKMRAEAKADQIKVGDAVNPLGFLGKVGRRLMKAMEDPDAEAKYLNDFADFLISPKGDKLLRDLAKAKSPTRIKWAQNGLRSGLAGAALGNDVNQQPLRIRVGTNPATIEE